MANLDVKVDPDLCSGCAVCESTAPEVFKMNDDNMAVVDAEGLAAAEKDVVIEAAESCPSEAIIVVDKETAQQIVPA